MRAYGEAAIEVVQREDGGNWAVSQRSININRIGKDIII
jgi:hypothetical protein